MAFNICIPMGPTVFHLRDVCAWRHTLNHTHERAAQIYRQMFRKRANKQKQIVALVVASHRWHHPRLSILASCVCGLSKCRCPCCCYLYMLAHFKSACEFLACYNLIFIFHFHQHPSLSLLMLILLIVDATVAVVHNNNVLFAIRSVQFNGSSTRKSSWQTERLQNRKCAMHSGGAGGGSGSCGGCRGSRTRYPILFITHSHS